MTEFMIVGALGERLAFQNLRNEGTETVFQVAVDVGWAQGRAEATTHINGPPTQLFREAASAWQGWDGELSWSDIEGRVDMRASSDRTGHVCLEVTLKGPEYNGNLRIEISLEVGQLATVASELKNLFGE